MAIIDLIKNLFTEEEANRLFPELNSSSAPSVQEVKTSDPHQSQRDSTEREEPPYQPTVNDSRMHLRIIDEQFRHRHRRLTDQGGQFWNGILQWDLHSTSFSVCEKRIIREIVRKIIWGEVFSEEELELGNSILDALPLMQISCDRIIQLGEPVKVIAPSSREDYLLLKRIPTEKRQVLFNQAYRFFSIEDCNALNQVFTAIDKGERNHPHLRKCAKLILTLKQK